MTAKHNHPTDAALSAAPYRTLRDTAETIADATFTATPHSLAADSAATTQQTLHELRVHQIELEMQNEELRRMRTELGASQARYLDLYNLAPVGYCTVSETGQILQANLTAAGLLRASPDELASQPFSQFILREDQDSYYLFGRRLFKSGGSQSCELRMVRNDGRPFWAQLAATTERGADGALELRVVLSDVTERNQAQEATRASEARYRAVTRTANEAVLTIDRFGTIVDANPACGMMFDYTEAELFGKALHTLMPERFRRRHRQGLRERLADGAPPFGGRCVEVAGLRRDGSEFPIELSAAQWVTDQGPFVTAIMRDITQRKSSEDQLRKLSLAVEQSHESILITNLDGRIEYVNEAFVQAAGYSREELIGKNPRVLQSGHTPAATFVALWDALTQGMPWQGEFHNRKKDGREYIELATITPLHQPDGSISHYVAVKEDITEKKRLAAELERHRHHLEALVEERTAELVAARQQADSANAAKSAFLANMSHEIRTPMNAIIGLTHLLDQGNPTPAQADRLRKIDRSARHLLSIVNDILDLSKVEAGKLRIEQVDFALIDVLAGISDGIGDRARDKGIQFSLIAEQDLPPRLCGDPLRLSQILLNLGTNAVKFTASGAVALRIQRIAVADDAVRLRFEMSDTGIGLAANQTDLIFQPFEQADVSTTRKYGGTGLGLAICQRLVHLLGGEIGVASQPGVGSTFWFELPFTCGQRARAGSRRTSASGIIRAIRTGVTPDRVRILVVEDDAISQEVATELLRAKGFVVDVAPDGAEALQRADAVRYDAILMDVQMPVMDGLTATRELRKRAAYASTPILAMTAGELAEDKDACNAAGMDDFLAKPIEPEAFFRTICRWTGAELVQPHEPAALPPGPAEGDWRGRLAATSGLSTAAGLRVVQGDWQAYERLLRRFCDERGDAVAALCADVQAGRAADAHRAAHTLKGLAATIGAEPLQRAAAAVESAMADDEQGPQALAARIATLDRELHALVDALRACLPAAPAEAETAVDWGAARHVLDNLEALLADDDVRALDAFLQHSAIIRTALGPAAAVLARTLEAFDLVGALQTLRDGVAAEPRLAPVL